jgi:hypothetical protein
VAFPLSLAPWRKLSRAGPAKPTVQDRSSVLLDEPSSPAPPLQAAAVRRYIPDRRENLSIDPVRRRPFIGFRTIKKLQGSFRHASPAARPAVLTCVGTIKRSGRRTGLCRSDKRRRRRERQLTCVA